jgi:hypothetical protein
VPLLVYVPDVEPHVVDGPVSVLDLLPTIADLAGVDLSNDPIEGESLTPQLFYARDAKQRIVFAETNYPDPVRAVVTQDYKLIYNLKANVYQLYDLRKDAWEKTNVWARDAAGATKMKRLLDEWLDRVFFNRDATNEAHALRSRILVKGKPMPRMPVAAEFGALEALGWDGPAGELKAGQTFTVSVYLRARSQPPGNYRFEVEAQVGTTPPIRNEVIPANGLYPTSHWRTDETIRLTFSFKVPDGWPPGPVSLRLRALDERRKPLPVTGPAADGGNRVLLGEVPLVVAAAPG